MTKTVEPTKEELLIALADVRFYVGLLPTKEENNAIRIYIATLIARYISAQESGHEELFEKLCQTDGPLREKAEEAYQERFPSRDKS